jgi:hypothetical protein
VEALASDPAESRLRRQPRHSAPQVFDQRRGSVTHSRSGFTGDEQAHDGVTYQGNGTPSQSWGPNFSRRWSRMLVTP